MEAQLKSLQRQKRGPGLSRVPEASTLHPGNIGALTITYSILGGSLL